MSTIAGEPRYEPGRAGQRTVRVTGELAKLARLARKQDWKITRAPDGHLDWLPPWGGRVRTPSTLGEGRSFQNTRMKLIRGGLVIRRGS
jgi:hypothetical protein